MERERMREAIPMESVLAVRPVVPNHIHNIAAPI